MTWISVEERLPPVSWNYIAYTPDREVIEAVYFADDKTWKTVAGFGYDCEQEELNNVTHWMPLPDPPLADSAAPRVQNELEHVCKPSCHNPCLLEE